MYFTSDILREMAKGKARNTITLVGAGNLSRALAQLLPAAGYEVIEIVTRSPSQYARQLGRETGAQVTTMASARWLGNIVWLAVGDSAIQEVSDAIAPETNWRGKIVLHSSGALSSQALLSLRRRGARAASVHPMMTFVGGASPKMAEVVWAMEGDRVAVAAARRIVGSLQGHALKIDPKRKPLYHAFGAFLSPLLVVHLVTAAEIALKIGIPRRELARVMKPIVERTLHNLLAHVDQPRGAWKAFSGPLVRGDMGTIRRHLESLRQVPDARNLYLALLESALESDLPVKNRSAIKKLLSGSR